MTPKIPKTILIIDDSDDDYEVISRSFKKVGIKNSIKRCVDGQDALDYLYQRDKYSQSCAPRPGVILLDLNMPGLDGRDVLRVVKSDDNLKAIPIFVLTTSDSDKDVIDCYDLGANSYMAKPGSFNEFVEALKRMKDFVFEITILPNGGV